MTTPGIDAIERLKLEAAKASAKSIIANYQVAIAERKRDIERIETELKRQQELIEQYDNKLQGR